MSSLCGGYSHNLEMIKNVMAAHTSDVYMCREKTVMMCLDPRE